MVFFSRLIARSLIKTQEYHILWQNLWFAEHKATIDTKSRLRPWLHVYCPQENAVRLYMYHDQDTAILVDIAIIT